MKPSSIDGHESLEEYSTVMRHEESLLSADNVHLRYGTTTALAGASITVSGGEIVAVVGSSGSGKSSLLYCLAGLAKPDDGKVHFDGDETTSLTTEQLADLRRRRFGFVFQFSELVPELTLLENVALPLQLNGVSHRRALDHAADTLQRLGITHEARRRPGQVSGGQAQRAAVARALVHEPDVVFADEPTGALDSENGGLVLSALTSLAKAAGSAVVLVTHDPVIARRADRVVVMRDGRTGRS